KTRAVAWWFRLVAVRALTTLPRVNSPPRRQFARLGSRAPRSLVAPTCAGLAVLRRCTAMRRVRRVFGAKRCGGARDLPITRLSDSPQGAAHGSPQSPLRREDVRHDRAGPDR